MANNMIAKARSLVARTVRSVVRFIVGRMPVMALARHRLQPPIQAGTPSMPPEFQALGGGKAAHAQMHRDLIEDMMG